MHFRPCPEPSVGVELELPIVDRESRELVPGARRILDACAEERLHDVSAELMQSMLEIRTSPCPSVGAVHAELIPRLQRVCNVANSIGYDLALLGTHPSAKPNEHAIAPDEHFAKAYQRMVWMIYHRVTFGLHVHVGVRSGDEAVWLINIMVQYLPHLIATAANSPFWQGVDTGLASARAALYNLVTHAGVPQYFTDWRGFRSYSKVMQECKALESVTSLKWDIRPRPDLGTIEVRACDTPLTLRHLLGVVALVRTLVIATQRLLADRPPARRGDIRRQWIATENRWLATRSGLGAIYIRTPGGKRRALRQEMSDLIARLTPVATETGDLRYLRHLEPIADFESGAQRQRRLYRETGRWEDIVEDSVGGLRRELAALVPRPAAATS